MSPAATPSMVYDLIEAGAQPGCPLCRVARRWAERFVSALLYEEVTDPHTRGRLKQSLGFCHIHAGQASETAGSLLGVAIIYRGLISQVSAALAETAPTTRRSWWKAKSEADAASWPGLAPASECPACIHQRDMEAAALAAMVTALPDNERLRAALSQPAGGLCLPHLRSALALARDEVAFAFLRDSTQQRLGSLIAELDEFIRKYDHRFRHEEWNDERDSWERAIAWMTGGPAEK